MLSHTTKLVIVGCFFLLAVLSAPGRDDRKSISPKAADKSEVIGPIYRLGCDVKALRAIGTPDPEHSEKVRKKKITGSVIVSLVVDTNGNA